MLKLTRTDCRGKQGIPTGSADDEIKALLEPQPIIRLAVPFGSVAKGEATVESDLDLAVSAGRPLTLTE